MTTTTADRERRFRDVYARTRDDVVRFTQRRAHPAHVEDIVSETYLVAWRRFDDLPRREAEARAWIFGIARNCLLNDQRGRNRRTALAVRITDLARAEASANDDADFRLDLAAAWHRLSSAEQEAIALAAFDGLSSAEAASVLAITPLTYRVRLMRARRRLRRELDAADGTQPTTNPTIEEMCG